MALPIELTLEDYWRIVKRRRWHIGFSFVVTFLLSAVYTLTLEPVYSSSATLKIEPPAGTTGVASAFGNWDPYFGVLTELRVIESATLAETSLRKMGRITDRTPPKELGGMIARFLGATAAQRVGDTSLVNVEAEANDPVEAAQMAQALAEAYMDQDVESRQRQAKQALENISLRKAQLEAELRRMEEERRGLQEKSPRQALAGSNLAGRLFELESQKALLLERYTEAHPEVQKLSTEIGIVSRQLRELPKEALDMARIERDIRVNESLYLNLAGQFESQRVAAASVVPLAQLVSRALPNPTPIRPDRKANLTFGAVLGVVIGLILVFVAENLDTSFSTVEDVERTLELPVLGLIPHIPLPDKEERSGLWAWFPMVGKHEAITDLRKRMVIYQPPHTPVVEAYHSLRASMESVLPKGKGHAVVFSSSGIAEGKTLSCMNFALAAIQSGARVLLVDVDLRRPSLHRMMGLPNDLGLTNVLIEDVPLERALKGAADFMIGTARVEVLLKTQGVENLSLLSAGSIKVNPTDLFKRPQFDKLLAKARERFDWVLLDCPPLLLFADGLVVSPKADGVVLFYQVGRMARSALKRAKDELLTVKARPLGIVLNDVRPKELEPRYGYYKSNYYYEYYQQEEESDKKG